MNDIEIQYKKIEKSILSSQIETICKQDSYIETKEFGIRYIKDLDDPFFLIEELRLPIHINIKSQLTIINEFITKHNILSDLKYLKKKIFILNNKGSKFKHILEKIKNQWDILFRLYHILLVIQIFYLNLLHNEDTSEITYLNWCYYLNNLALTKFSNYLSSELDPETNWKEFSNEIQCIDHPITDGNKLDYFKLLAEQNNFVDPNNDDDIGKAVFYIENSVQYVGVIKDIIGPIYKIYISKERKTVDKTIDDITFIKSISNEIYNLENLNQRNTIEIEKTPYINKMYKLYTFFTTSFCEYKKSQSVDINYTTLYSDIYSIIYLNIEKGYYLNNNSPSSPPTEIIPTTQINPGGKLLNKDKAFVVSLNNSEGDSSSYKLNNCYNSNIIYQGIIYPSIEHALQAQKFSNKSDKEKFSINGELAKYDKLEEFKVNKQLIKICKEKNLIGVIAKLGLKKVDLPKPKNISNTIILTILRLKFSNEEMKELLLKTESKTILNIHTFKDTTKAKKSILECLYKDSRVYGGNLIGIYLMKIRDEMKPQQTISNTKKEFDDNIVFKDLHINNMLSYQYISNIDIISRPYKIIYQISEKDYIKNLSNTKLKNRIIQIQPKLKYTNDIIYLKDYKDNNIIENTINDKCIDLYSGNLYNKATQLLVGTNNNKLDIINIDLDVLKKYNYMNRSYPFYIYGFNCNNIIKSLNILSYYKYINDQGDTNDLYIFELLESKSLIIEKLPIFNTYIKDLGLDFLNNSPLINDIDINSNELIRIYGELTLENFILKRLLLAQFTQNNNLLDILINSNDTLLIGYNEYGYYYMNAIMDIRYLLKSDFNNIPFYYNKIKELELLEKKNKIIKIKDFLLKPLQDDIFPSKEDAYDFFKKDKSLYSSINVIYDSDIINFSKLELSSELKKKQMDINNNLKKELLIINSNITKDNYINKLDTYINICGLTYFNLPQNGDSLFISICDQLNYYNLLPKIYSNELTLQDNYKVLEKASTMLRNDLADKISINKDILIQDIDISLIDNKDPYSLEQAIKIISEKLSLVSSSDNTFKNYLDKLKLSCSSDNIDNKLITGIWGGHIELMLISALMNVNIKCIGLNISEDTIEIEDSILIVSDHSSNLFNNGISYNKDYITKTINIIYINDKINNITTYMSTRKKNESIDYIYIEDENIVLRKTYNKNCVKMNMIEIGSNFDINTGIFDLLPEITNKNINIDYKSIIPFRYFINNDTITYKNTKIGFYIDNEYGVSFI